MKKERLGEVNKETLITNYFGRMADSLISHYETLGTIKKMARTNPLKVILRATNIPEIRRDIFSKIGIAYQDEESMTAEATLEDREKITEFVVDQIHKALLSKDLLPEITGKLIGELQQHYKKTFLISKKKI